ncbi:MAG: 50S ribosomal protein L17 [Patescibacteria group bacterium]|nr:50S ribosomal protein L17 [Patescibacteria group bacterium]
MHRRSYKGRKLSRKAHLRKSAMRSLTSQIILYEKVTTTITKAKEVRPIIEKFVTKAKVDSVARRRDVAKFLSANDKALEKLFVELGPLYKERKGGYTRITRIGARPGDNTEMAVISLLDTEKLTKKEITKEKEKKAEKKEKKETKAPKKGAKTDTKTKKETKAKGKK